MKKFLLKSFLFLSPFLSAILIELFILPIDFFTFRVWEALVTTRELHLILKGPFYPNMEITKIEEGDLTHHTKLVSKREVKWITDRYGYRKYEASLAHYKVVVIGDSNIAGCGSTQQDMLSEVLEEKLRVSVYPLAPGSMNTFLKEKRFMDQLPDIVILGSAERFIFDLTPIKISPKEKSTQWKNRIRKIENTLKKYTIRNQFIQFVGVCLDRIYKENMLHYLRASLRRIGSSHSPKVYSNSISSEYGPVFFLQGADANKDVPKDQVDKAVQAIKTYNDLLRSQGIRFIFLPIPEKENIYYEYLQTKKPVFLEQLIFTLKKMGIKTVDTQKAFDEAFRKGVWLYHTNDTHWNENAVKITADLIKELIEKKE